MRIQSLAIFLASALFFASCSTDFKTGDDYKDIVSVYALFSTNDTAHYVKINKGFFSETQNNLIIAQNPDSLYFSNLDVKLEELSNGNVTKTHTLQKVDLVSEGYVKDTGVFANTPNYAFKLKDLLDASKTYRLVVKNLSSGEVIDAYTSIINSSNIKSQFPKAKFDRISFFDPAKGSNFKWDGTNGATFYDLYIRFFYQEKNVSTQVTTNKYKDIAIAKNIIPSGSSATAIVKMEDFYAALNGALEANNNLVRYVDTPGIVIQAGGQDLKTYIDVNSAQGGITADQIKPNFTNLRKNGVVGKEVFGIVSTRGTALVYPIPFDQNTINYMQTGVFAKSLNIIGVSPE